MWSEVKKLSPEPTWQTHACFGNNCAEWAAGAPHKCEIGKCKKYEDALQKWKLANSRQDGNQEVGQGKDDYDS